jgi:hypothetical protein
MSLTRVPRPSPFPSLTLEQVGMGGHIYLLLHFLDRLHVGRQMGRDRAQEPSVGRRDVLCRPLDIAMCRAEELGYFGSLRLIGIGS